MPTPHATGVAAYNLAMATVHETRYRLLYRDTDPMRVLYYSRYFELFEMGRTEFVRAEGYTYARMETELGLVMPVTEANAKYRRSIYFDEIAVIRTRIVGWTRATVRYSYDVYAEGRDELCAEGETELAVLRLSDGRPTGFPPDLLEVFERVAPEAKGRRRAWEHRNKQTSL